MSAYGNILTIHADASNQTPAFENYLVTQNLKNEKVGSTYFILTPSMPATNALVAELNTLGIGFIFFHNKISTGSYIDAGATDQDIIDRINKILF